MKKILYVFAISFVIWLVTSLSLLAFATQLVYDHHQDISNQASFEYEESYIKSSEGKSFQAWFIPNPHSSNIILYLHGNTGRYPPYIQELKKYANVFSPSYPGFFPSEGTPSTQSINDCATRSVEYLLRVKGYKESQIIVWGHSLGGSPSLHLAQHYPLLNKVILINTFDSIRKMGMRRYGPLAYFAGHIHNSMDLAKKAKAKIRQFHVIEDDIVPLQAGLKLYKAIASLDKRFILLEEGDHTRFDIWKTLFVEELPYAEKNYSLEAK